MHVDVRGPDDAGPVVLLHGGTGTGDYHWRKVARVLEDRWRLHLPDLPGHGRTPLQGERFDRDLLVEAVDDLLGRLGPPIHVAAFSMGGHAALQLATERPERFASLTVIGVSIRDHAGLQGWRSYFDPDHLASEQPLWARTLSRIHEPLGGPDAWREVLRRDAGGVATDLDVTRLAALEAPLLLVRGDRDPAVDPFHYAEIRAAVGSAEECVIPAGGHEVQMTRSELVAPVLADFLQRASG